MSLLLSGLAGGLLDAIYLATLWLDVRLLASRTNHWLAPALTTVDAGSACSTAPKVDGDPVAVPTPGRLHRRTGAPRTYPMVRGTLLRVVGAGLVLLLIARTGGGNLIAALIGLFVVRTVVIWRVGRVPDA
jgi:hypothetical protein